jgi:hypothetical protein
MTKLSEVKDRSQHESKLEYVNEVWASWRASREQTLNRITNYLFALNTGALLTTLTYVATKSANGKIHVSIWLFALGIFFSVSHAALDYYFSEFSFKAYRSDVDDLYSDKLGWEEFVKKNESRPPCDWLLHTLGWLGGIAFFGGLVLGLCQI